MLRERLQGLISNRPVKIMLARAVGHGFDFIWTVGVPKTESEVAETLAHRGPFYLFGEEVPEDIVPEVLDFFERFCCREIPEDALATWPGIH
ncbi:MAG: hypothetical protein JXB04_11290 [Kiritimatiellae bacterium]|nr:hypothetical protein [Kiritimatiellia bacterium]